MRQSTAVIDMIFRRNTAGRLLPAMLLVASLFVPTGLAAQDATSATEPSTVTGEPAAVTAEEPGVRRIYVPLEDLDVVINRDKRGVMLPQAEFRKLFQLARKNASTTPQLPSAVIVTSVDYAARISGEQLLVTATVQLTQFTEDWQSLTLPLSQLAVEKATLNGAAARLGRVNLGKQGFGLQLLNNQPGQHTLVLELSTPMNAVGSDKVAAFGLLPAPAAMLNITLPAGKHLLVDRLSLERPADVEQSADYHIAVGGKRQVSLRFTDRQLERNTDSLLFATTAYGLNVAPGEVTWHAVTSLQVFGTAIDRLVFQVPNTLEIADVEATGLEAWELADNPNDASQTTITLNFRQPLDGGRQVTLKGVMTTAAETPWRVPNLTLNNTTSHVGRIVVQHPPGVRLRTAEANGVRHGEAAAMIGNQRGVAPPVASPNSLRFDVWREDFTLSFVTLPKDRELQAGMSTILEVSDSHLQLQMIATVQTFFAPLFELEIILPADWTITDVKLGDRSVDWQMLPHVAGLHQVHVRLDPPLAANAEQNIVISARRDFEQAPIGLEPVEFTLPEIRLPQSAVVEGTYVIKADADLEVVPLELSGLDPANIGITDERLGFRYQDTRFSGRLHVARKPARISSKTLTFTRLEQQTLHARLDALLTISGGGLRAVRLALSESAGTNLRFVSLRGDVRIVEQLPAEPANGVRIWTVIFDRWVHGQVGLAVDVSVERGDATEFVTPTLHAVDAERENGHIAIEAASDQRLSLTAVDAAGQQLPAVDAADLPLPAGYLPKERVVAAYRAFAPGYRVAFSEERFERLAVPTAICHSSQIESVLGQTGEFQHQATFTFVAVGVQSVRVQLPQPSELWAALIDEQPVEVRATSNAYLVAIPAGTQPDASHRLQLHYKTHHSPLTSIGRVTQQPPELSVVNGSGEEQPLDILEQDWTVHHPEKTLFVDSRGLFAPQSDLDAGSFLGSIRQGFTIASPTELAEGAYAVAGVVIFVAMITFGVRRRGVLGCLTAGGVTLLLGFVLIALLMPATQKARESATRIQHLDDLIPFSPETGPTSGAVAEKADSASFFADTEENSAEATPAEPATEMDPAKPADRYGAQANDPFGGENKPNRARRELADFKQELAAKEKGGFAGQNEGLGAIVQDNAAPPMAAPGEPTSRPAQGDGTDKGMISDLNTTIEPQPGALQFGIANGNFINGADANADLASKGDSTPQRKLGGLLSLAIGLEVPADTTAKVFRYVGNATGSGAVGLNLSYESRQAGNNCRLFLMAALALVMWWLRRRSLVLRTIVAVAGIVIPLALITVTPSSWHTVLDGVFLGAVVGTGLWLMLAAVAAVQSANEKLQATIHGRKVSSATILLLAGSLAGLWDAPIQAQSQSAPPTKVSKPGAMQQQSSRATAPRPTPPVPITPAKPTHPRQTPTVVIPYDSAGDPLTAERVFLPYDQFLELWNSAHPEQRMTGPAPLAGVITEALYACRLQTGETRSQHVVEVDARFVLHSFRKTQIVLTVPLGQTALSSAQLDGEPAALQTQTTKSGVQLQVVLAQPGAHVLDLKFQVPAEQAGPAGQFTLPLAAVPAGRVSFLLPADDLLVRVNGAANTYRLRKEGADTYVEAAVDSGGNVTIAWQPEQTRTAIDGIVHAESAVAVVVDDTGVRLSAGSLIRVPQGALSELSFALPESLRLQTLSGPDVGGWEIAGEGDLRTLKVFFRRKVDDETRVHFELYLNVDVTEEAAAFTLPPFGPTGVTRDVGQIAFYAVGPFDLRATTADNVSRINAAQFQPAIKLQIPSTPPELAYRYTVPTFDLQMQVSRRKPASSVDVQHAVFVGRRKVQHSSHFRFQLTAAAQSGLSFQLPAGYLPVDVSATHLADWYVTGDVEQGAGVLTIEFNAPQTGVVEVVLSGNTSKDPDEPVAGVSTVRPLEISNLRSLLGVWLDEAYSGRLGNLMDWRTIPPSGLPQELRQRQTRRVDFAFQSSDTAPLAIEIALTRAVPQLKADSVTVITVADTLTDYSLSLNWQITQAAADRFVFTTPDWLADKLTFNDPRIRQVASTAPNAGRVQWTITLQDPVRDRYFVLAQAQLPPADANQISAPLVRFQQHREGVPTTLEVQQNYVMLINQSSSQLTAITVDAVESVTGEQLPIAVSADLLKQAAEIVRIRNNAVAPVWQIQKFEQQQAAPASVNLADLVMVIAADGTWRLQAVYTIKNRARQFLALELPVDARLISIFVGDRPSRLVETTRNGKQIHLAALPKTSEADLAFPVKLVLTGRLTTGSLPKGFRPRAAEIDLPAPRVISQTDDPDFGIPVAKTLWTVYLPEDLNADLIKDPGRSNLSDAGGDRRGVAYALDQTRSALELASVVENSPSSRVRYQAMRNLKNLQQSIDGYLAESAKDYGSSYGYLSESGDAKGLSLRGQLDSEEGRQLLELRESLNKKLAENRGKMKIDEAKKEIVILSDGSRPQRVEEEQLQQQIEFNNDALITSNSVAGINLGEVRTQTVPRLATDSEQQLGENFNYRLLEAAPNQKLGRAFTGKDVANPSSAENRLKRRQQNLDNIQQLERSYATMNQSKQQSPQDQAARQRGGRGAATHFDRFYSEAELPKGRQAGENLNLGIPQPDQDSDDAMNGYGFALVPQSRFESDDTNGNGVLDLQGGTNMVWSQAGGLSLQIGIPQDGQKLSFSKISGAPKLALAIRPRETLKIGFGLIWTIVWLAVGIVVIVVAARSPSHDSVARAIPVLLVAIGLIAFFTLPMVFSICGFMAFVLGAAIFGFQHCQHPQAK